MPHNMLTVDNLAMLTTQVQMKQISLQLLVEYYEKYLMPRSYIYTISNGVQINLEFPRDAFCHLLGIEEIAKGFYPKGNPNLFLFKGTDGFKRAKKGKIEFKGLEKLCQPEFTIRQRKFINFHFMHRLVMNPTLVSYRQISGSKITCDFLFYNGYDVAIIHLGIEKDSRHSKYFPKTFLVTYHTETDVNKFITGQTQLSIISVQEMIKGSVTAIP
jgi:hypothetical protein